MLPMPFIGRMQTLLGDGLADYLAELALAPSRALHLNTAKASEAQLDALGCARIPIPYAYDGYYIDTDEKIGNHPLHHAGAFYMQEPSAMMPVAAAKIERGMRVLDLCASPGGKSTQLANRIGEGGLLVANEIVPSRCQTLAGNIERMGLRNAIVTCTDAQMLGKALPAYFDVILVDAPCSGEGMFRKMPEAAAGWSEALPAGCAKRQREILTQILPALAPGGLLIYSTCTFSPEENEETVSFLLKTHPTLSLEAPTSEVAEATVPAASAFCDEGVDPRLMRRFYPHISKGEGQFCALLRQSGAAGHRDARPVGKHCALSRTDERIARDFLAEVLTSVPDLPLSAFKGGVVLLPAELPLDPRLIYANGVTVGEVKKGRVIPHHAFFSAYGQRFCRRLDLSPDDERTAAYLHGDTVPCELPDGWAVVSVSGVPLGGIKVSGGIAKNHYPKGLRRP